MNQSTKMVPREKKSKILSGLALDRRTINAAQPGLRNACDRSSGPFIFLNRVGVFLNHPSARMVDTAQIARGAKLFKTRCGQCHTVEQVFRSCVVCGPTEANVFRVVVTKLVLICMALSVGRRAARKAMHILQRTRTRALFGVKRPSTSTLKIRPNTFLARRWPLQVSRSKKIARTLSPSWCLPVKLISCTCLIHHIHPSQAFHRQ
jgi:hypothetical protein